MSGRGILATRSAGHRHVSLRRLWLVATLCGAATLAARGEAPGPDPALFPLPEGLRSNVAFWTRVYTQYPNDHVLLHDDLYLDVVYAVLDFRPLEESSLSEPEKRRIRERETRRVRDKYETVLRNLAAGKTDPDLAAEEARVLALFTDVPGDRSRYLQAVDRLRTQTCLRNRFAEGIERSGAYLGAFEEIFRGQGLPTELTRLPFVESLFQTRAHSKAAAAGLWQFVASTARPYLRMTWEVDERFDPLLSADAAARLLAKHHADLGSWPLAITAYNHGANGMQRAVATVGSKDLGEIARRYRSRSFGFASRNFYAEFLAAARIYDARESHFPGVRPAPPLDFDQLVPDRYVALGELAKTVGLEVDALKELNPALSPEVWAGHLLVPEGYPLRVPAGRGEELRAAYEALPEEHKPAHQTGLRYRVRPGDTLAAIAARHGTTVAALQRANGLRSPHLIRAGQLLLIPPGGKGAPRAGAAVSYQVRPGDTLSVIARRNATDVRTLQAVNRLHSADDIRVGQRLRIPAGRQTHVVAPGETLAAIARHYGTTVRALQLANRITSHLIHPSQVLVIP